MVYTKRWWMPLQITSLKADLSLLCVEDPALQSVPVSIFTVTVSCLTGSKRFKVASSGVFSGHLFSSLHSLSKDTDEAVCRWRVSSAASKWSWWWCGCWWWCPSDLLEEALGFRRCACLAVTFTTLKSKEPTLSFSSTAWINEPTMWVMILNKVSYHTKQHKMTLKNSSIFQHA